MDWYFAQNNERRGPVTEAALQTLARAGQIQPSTLVWREGFPNWQPYSASFPPILPAQPGQTACTECGKSFPEADLLRVRGSAVCAGCKPVYLAKVAHGDPTGICTVWKWRKELVISRESALPDRCVKCNTSNGVTKLKRKLMWHHPAVYLLIFVGLLVYAIVALVVRKQATVFVGLCDRHRQKRTNFIIATWVLFSLSIGGIVYGIAVSSPEPAVWISAGALFLAAIFTGAFGARVIYPTKIDAQYTRVRGVCKEYLAELPEWHGA